MKNVFKLLLIGLALTSCGVSESSSSNTSSSSSNEFTISAYEGRTMPEYKKEGSTYTFYLSNVKTGVVLSGNLEGNIVISDEKIESGSTIANMAFELNQASISSSDSTAFYYSCKDKKLTIEAKKGTTNSISTTSNNEDPAIESKNNLDIGGKGILNISSSTGHAIKADRLTIASSTEINVKKAGKDGIHVKELNMNDEGKMFNGSISLSNVTKQAISVTDYKEGSLPEGLITWSTSEFNISVSGAKNVLNIDNSTTIPEKAKITATNISGNFAKKEASSLNVNLVVNSENVTCNGNKVSGTITL